MSEYLMQQGRRVETRQELMKKEIIASGLRESLRLALDPLVECGKLDAETILTQAAALAEEIDGIKILKAQLLAIEKIIGK